MYVRCIKRYLVLTLKLPDFIMCTDSYEITEGKWAAVIGKWRGDIQRGETIKIHGDGEQRRDFTHVDDIVDGLIKIGFGTETHEDAWELGTGFNYSLNEVANMFNVLCEYC